MAAFIRWLKAFDRQLHGAIVVRSNAMDNPTTGPEDQKPLVRVNKDKWVPMSGDNITLIAGTLIAEAIKRRAAEIHVDHGQDKVTVRYLVDGVLRDGFKLPRLIHPPLVYCLKHLGRPTLRTHQDINLSIERSVGRIV
jgi:type II secretory ATPase GspE/PulE/Tfp pilus assembly ATPase PilB-like protein